ncbi:MAG: GAF domain-containing protein, partial [Ignavibacteria bacterium]|nr:GAF domain-containing protein [Ignavibacteria bacterium]
MPRKRFEKVADALYLIANQLSKLAIQNVQQARFITERKRAESQIRKLNRIYAVLSNINQAIVRIHNTKDIFDEACRIAVEYGKFKMVWIGIVNPHTNKVDVVASSGVEGTYLENLNIDLSDDQLSSGPTGTAIRTGIHKISNNIVDDESMRLWRDEAIKHGYKSTAAFPLLVFNKVVGAFCIYSEESNFFENDDVVLLDEMVKDISFAMEFIETETDRKHAEEALHHSEERFRRLAENAPDVIYRMSLLDGKYEYVSPAAFTIFGYSPEEYYENPTLFKQSIHPDWYKYFDEQWTNLQEGKMLPTYEYQIIHKSGEVRWINQRNILVHDESGNSIAIEGIVTNITERKQAEQTLHQASEEIRDLYNHAPCGYHSLDKDGVFVRIN